MPTPDVVIDDICTLLETSGVPGYEDRVRKLVIDSLSSSVDRVRTDAMGNVVGTLEGESSYSVVVAAHMDEIGFMVRHVAANEDDEFGFLELDPLGGWDPKVLTAQRVTVHTDDGDLPGVIGSPPPHTGTDDDGELSIDDLFVDVGLPAAEVNERVSTGDLVTLERTATTMGETITGKALDDRICLFAMLEAADRLSDPPVTIHFCATVQEEVGLRGAAALGVDIDPDQAIALDVTVANDVPSSKDGERVTELGEGVAVKLKDSSVITNPKFNERIRAVADEREIPYQLEILPRGGTDTAEFQRISGAKPVGALSIPTRYLHTTTETAHLEDVEAMIDLLVAVLETEDESHDYTL